MMAEISRWMKTFILSRRSYQNKFILGSYQSFFWYLSLKTDGKNKNWRQKENDRINLKASATKTDTKSEEEDDSKTVFSDLTFTVASVPSHVQSHSTLDASAIPEYPTIKGIFSAAGTRIQVLFTTITSNIDTLTLVIPKSQMAMLANKGATLVDQGGYVYLSNALMLSDCKSLYHVIYKPIANGETNTPYLLQPSLSPSYTKEEIPSSKCLASLMSSGE